MNSKLAKAGIFILVISVVAGSFLFTNYMKSRTKSVTNSHIEIFSDSNTGLSLQFDKSKSQSTVLSDQDKHDKIILRLIEKDENIKPHLVTVRYEEGLAKAATLLKQPLIDYLESSANLTLAKKAGFELQESKRITIVNKESLSFQFNTNTNENDVKATQKFVIVPTSNDKAIYISMQATQMDFKELDDLIFKAIVKSIKF